MAPIFVQLVKKSWVMQMTKILGLTGGIASGKTTVSNYLRSLNIPLIDADLLARKVMRAGQPAVAEIVEVFGKGVLLANGEINRQELGRIVFESEDKRKELNRIVQYKIREEIQNEIETYLKDEPTLIVLDIPLLYEENYEREVDEVMVVYVDSDTQKDRLLKRDKDLSEVDAINRINSQMALSEKAKRADVVIDNNGSVESSIEQVSEWLQANFSEGLFE